MLEKKVKDVVCDLDGNDSPKHRASFHYSKEYLCFIAFCCDSRDCVYKRVIDSDCHALCNYRESDCNEF